MRESHRTGFTPYVRAVVKTWAVVLIVGGGLGFLGGALVFLGMLMGGQASNVSGTTVQTVVSGVLLAVGIGVFRSASRYIVNDEVPTAI